jgi:uridine kinase
MRKINIIVSGEVGAGSTTCANVVADALKQKFSSGVFNRDQDEIPEMQSTRVATLEKDGVHITIQTRQEQKPGAIDYTEQVKSLLKDLPREGDKVNLGVLNFEQIQRMYSLANQVGIQSIHLMGIYGVVNHLKEWLDTPQKVGNLKSREIAEGVRKSGEGKVRKGKVGGFGLKG